MNQLETNLTIWAICSILLLEILIVICICRCCFNRIKPKRFYVKREEYEYLQGNDGLSSHFQTTILRPPHADELAVVGTIREQNPSINFDNGIPNFGYYRDDDDEIIPPVSSLTHAPSSPSSPPINWIELRSPLPPLPTATTTSLIHTDRLSPADYEIRPYPTEDFLYTYQSPPSRSTIIDFRQYPDEYNDDDQFKDDYDDDDLDHFRFHSLRRPEIIPSHIKRTDTSTDTFVGNYSTPIPKSILKGSISTTPPIDTYPISYSQINRSRTSSKYDESPHMSVKINTDESIAIDYPTSAIEKTIPNQSIVSSNIPITLSSSISSNRMRFASVSQLNEVEWEVPSEFQTIVYGSTDDRQTYRGASMYSSNENLNNNNNINAHDNGKLSNRQRSQSAIVDQRTHVSRIFVPWDHEKKILQPLYLSNGIEKGDTTQQQAFEY